jgi:hypothetical protein
MTAQATPFFLIVADYDQGFFSVEGPMIDDRQWKNATKGARSSGRKIKCGPDGPDRDALALEYRRACTLSGVLRGSIWSKRRSY